MSKTNDERDELIEYLETQVNTMCASLCEIAKDLGVETRYIVNPVDPVELAGECAAAARKRIENKYGHDPLPQPYADHYEFTGETITYTGETLYRIRSRIDRPHHGVKAGDKGGWIGLNATLGENAWITRNAVACDCASVDDAAKLCFYAVVSGYGRVQGNALVEDCAVVSGYAVVEGDAVVSGYAVVEGDARVTDNARLCGETKLGNNVVVCGESLVNAPITITDSTIRDARICAEPSRGGDNDE